MSVDFANVWAIARKDLSIVWKKRQVSSSLVIWPLVLGILLPVVMYVAEVSRPSRVATIHLSGVEALADAFTLVFVWAPLAFETYIASYTFVGEKLEKTLEPLIATPVTDGEILLGKMLVAIVPMYITVYGSMVLFIFLMNFALSSLVQGYMPDPVLQGVMLVDIVSIIFSAEFNAIISARASRIGIAQMLGFVPVFPFMILYVLAEISSFSTNPIITLDFNGLLILAVVFLAIDVAFFFICVNLFRREKMLTRGK
jgi:ABC-type Na+ efflux pump permease subunit